MQSTCRKTICFYSDNGHVMLEGERCWTRLGVSSSILRLCSTKPGRGRSRDFINQVYAVDSEGKASRAGCNPQKHATRTEGTGRTATRSVLYAQVYNQTHL